MTSFTSSSSSILLPGHAIELLTLRILWFHQLRRFNNSIASPQIVYRGNCLFFSIFLFLLKVPRVLEFTTEHVIPFHSSFVRFLRGPNWIISTAIDRCRSISDIFLWAWPWTSVGGLFTANTGPWYNAREFQMSCMSPKWWGSRNHK